MAHQLRIEYDGLQEKHTEARERTSEAKIRYDAALVAEQAIERELKRARDALDNALGVASQPPVLQTPAAPGPGAPPQEAPPGAFAPRPGPAGIPETGVPPSVRETLKVFPPDDTDIGVGDLREKFGLSDGAVYARIQKAKRCGLVVSVGWGRYRLTADGKQWVANLLRLVPLRAAND